MKNNDLNNKIFKNKNILYIPIISMQDRKTGLYNLSGDGNVNRFITTFSHNNSFNNLTIYLPKNHIVGSEKYLNQFKDKFKNINFVYSEFFGNHASEQRKNSLLVNNIILSINNIEDYDLIITESQLLTKKLLNFQILKNKIIYWCPVCEIPNKEKREFLTDYVEIDNYIFKKAKYIIIASIDQYEYLKQYKDKLIYNPQLIDRNLFLYEKNLEIENLLKLYKAKYKNIFYIPYRITDSGFLINTVIKILYKLYQENKEFIVLYTNPNNASETILNKIKELIFNNQISNLFEYHNFIKKFLEIPNTRDLYYTILDSDNFVIIPYLENLEYINHASIHEFLFSKSTCKIILRNSNKNPYNIKGNNRTFFIDQNDIISSTKKINKILQ